MPGESLEREINDTLDDEVMPAIFVMVLVAVLVAFEWLRWFFKWPPYPVPITIIGAIYFAYYARKVLLARKTIANLKQGRDGERTVGGYLAEFQREGFRIFNDIPGERGNIDHVIVSPHGVFVVETKTISKPVGRNAVVTFDGVHVLVDGRSMDRDPVEQALAQRSFLRKRLNDALGRPFPVRAVVVFPGWWVERATGKKRDDIWVLSPGAVPSFIKNEPVALQTEDVARVSTAIVDYLRSRAA